ncbi:MAG: M24 family metallopeptidase [Acidimicrobiales bacterium]
MGPREEVEAKLGAVRAWLAHERREGALFGSQADFAWLTAGADDHVSLDAAAGVASLLVTADDFFLLTKNNERPRIADEEVAGLDLTMVEWPWYDPDGLAAAVARLCPPDKAVSDIGHGGVAPAPPSLAALRFTLLPAEVERFRRLGVDAAEAVEAACLTARRGDAETDVAAVLARECGRRGILVLVNLVGADARIDAYRHPVPTSHRVDRTLLVALTGRRHGLHASLTRMVEFGEPDARRAAHHRACRRVDTRYLLESRPGAALVDVFARGVEQYEAEGFADEWRLHHQGGTTGYAGREVFGTPSADHRLDANQVVAWNPSITGAKSEDTVLVTDNGPEVLTRTAAWPQERVELTGGAMDRPVILGRARAAL